MMQRLWLTSEEYQERHRGRVRRQLTPEESARIFMYQGMGSGSGAWNPGNPVMPGGTGGGGVQPPMALPGGGAATPQSQPPGIEPLPFGIRLSYNVQEASDSAFGYGWTLNSNQKLTENADGSATLY